MMDAELRNASGSAPDAAGFMTFEEMLGTLRRSLWIVVLATLLGLGVSYWWVSSETQFYQSNAVIRLLDTRSALTSGIADNSGTRAVGSGADPILSEIMVLGGRAVLGQVVDQLGLRLVDASSGIPPEWATGIAVDVPDEAGRSYEVRFGAREFSVAPISDAGVPDEARAQSVPYGASFHGEGVGFTVAEPPAIASSTIYVIPRYAAVDLLGQTLAASARRSTDGIDVAVVSPDPEFATEAVNSVVLTYQRLDAVTTQQQATRRRIFLESQLATQDSLLDLAEADLAAYRSSRQVYGSQGRLEAQQAGMIEIESRRRDLESNRRLYQSLLSNLDDPVRWAGDYGVLVSSPGIAGNPVVEEYYARLLDYQMQRDSLTTGPRALTPLYPSVQRLDSLLARTESRLADALASQVTALDARIAELGALQSASASEMAGPLSAEAGEGRLARRVETVRGLSDQLRSEVQLTRVEEAVETGQVEIVELAARALPIDRRPVQKLLLGAAMGLLLGIAIGFFREAANRTLVRAEDVERLFQVETFAVVPQIRSNRRSRKILPNRGARKRRIPQGRPILGIHTGAPDDVVRSGRNGDHLVSNAGAVEAYRTLRANLLFAPTAQSVRTLVVTSASPKEGKTMTVCNLGLAFARQGARVMMVDADLRRPDLAKLLGLPKAPGLTELLSGEADLASAVRRTDIDGLEVIPSGYLSRSSSELLCGRRMEELLETLSTRYDLVLIDTPPLLATADAAVLGALSDGVLMVVRARFVDKRAARQVREQLRHVGARLIGTVLNDPDGKVPQYGGYYGHPYEYDLNPEYRRPPSATDAHH